MMSVRPYALCLWMEINQQDILVDWVRYDRVVSSIGEILNSALRAILGLFNDTPSYVSVEIPEEIQQPGLMGRGQ